MRKWERARSKDGPGVCYSCLRAGLHVCDKRERPLPMFTHYVLSKYAPCLCAVCVWSVDAFQRSNNAVTCVGLCQRLHIAPSESPHALHTCQRFGRFFLFYLVCITAPFTEGWIEGSVGGWYDSWVGGGGGLLRFPKVREQSLFSTEEVEVSPVLQFICLPLRFAAKSRVSSSAGESTGCCAERVCTPQALHRVRMWRVDVHTLSTRLCAKRGNVERSSWVVKYRWELNRGLNQECSNATEMGRIWTNLQSYKPDLKILFITDHEKASAAAKHFSTFVLHHGLDGLPLGGKYG